CTAPTRERGCMDVQSSCAHSSALTTAAGAPTMCRRETAFHPVRRG
ncbi:MAG: hypothetical protein AVDCRST_MAG77-440, partial [uncultured Chloroflexi bacterium]